MFHKGGKTDARPSSILQHSSSNWVSAFKTLHSYGLVILVEVMTVRVEIVCSAAISALVSA